LPIENRTWTQAYQAAIPAARHNELQDWWTLGWEMNTSDLNGRTYAATGECSVYGQFACNVGAHTVLDNTVEWRGRVLEIACVGVGAANQLPQQVNYDPNNGAGTWDWNLMYTDTGANLAAVPVGISWQVPLIANCYIFAANAAGGGVTVGDLVFRNNGGANVWVMVRAQRTNDMR